MSISKVSNSLPIRPQRPPAPKPPPGGNIENRQPPAEPRVPSKVSDNVKLDTKKGIKTDLIA